MRDFLMLFLICILPNLGCRSPMQQQESTVANANQESDLKGKAGSTNLSLREIRSPFFKVSEQDIGFYSDSSWRHVGQVNSQPWQASQYQLDIMNKMIAMVKEASAGDTIAASWFLFDSMYANADGSPSQGVAPNMVQTLTKELTDALKRNAHVYLIFDPLNRAYTDRIPEALKELSANGAHIFFSDLSTGPAAVKSLDINALSQLLQLPIALLEPIGQKNSKIVKILEAIHKAHEHYLSGTLIFDDQSQEAAKIEAIRLKIASLLKEGTPSDPDLVEANPTSDMFAMLGSIDPRESLSRGKLVDKNTKKTMMLDGYELDLDFVFNAALLKANHRKILTIIPSKQSGKQPQALVSSANPHNASLPSLNSALSVRGPLAAYIYNSLVVDMERSLQQSSFWAGKGRNKMAHRYGYSRNISNLSPSDIPSKTILESNVEPTFKDCISSNNHCARYITESEIGSQIIRSLLRMGPEDRVRIQMFYLSHPGIIDTIIKVANRNSRARVQLLLDPNLDAFNAEKDGSPNRQVAAYISQKAPNVEIRWYATSGQQNHAKSMSIHNETSGRYELITGSGNWTTKNLGYTTEATAFDLDSSFNYAPNMEANMIVVGRKLGETPKYISSFNKKFDEFWQRQGTHSFAYKDHPLAAGSEDPYKASSRTVKRQQDPFKDGFSSPKAIEFMNKWQIGERSGLVAW